MTLTDRYVAATLRRVPADQHADLEQELRASVADAVEAKVEAGTDPARAETDVLNDLGDPDRLAADLAGRPLYLIGPTLYLDWLRLLKVLLWVSLIPGAIVLATDLVDGDAVGSAIWSGIWTTASVALQIAFWTTLVFVLLERYGSPRSQDELTGPWTVDRLPTERAPREVTLVDTVVSVGLLVLVAAVLLLQNVATYRGPDGTAVPVLQPDLWPVWTGVLVALVAVEIVLTILVYARGRWTVGLAVANTVVGVLFAAAVVWLASADRLVNPAFLEVTGGDSVTWLSNAIVAGTLVITGWDVVSVWVKALRSPRA
ncbi:permease prefix domain 1-containing protein [Cellulosimicrobium cellulans]|uniref:permease prefix domain 1-containing protein n=1 Tax=Cellulosimicrobium cellulans TaxID=1710 RepID=UPI00209854D7|nr:permease prefix domain 1-containing protein [Cellulosimicrobium cellulans]MCO7273465.1 permease prefix domain 1-containing protein [Cellulosimicrobium cellulans]